MKQTRDSRELNIFENSVYAMSWMNCSMHSIEKPESPYGKIIVLNR